MKTKLLLIITLIITLFTACNDDKDNIDPNSSMPVIKFPLEQLDVDMNKIDNLPVIAIIKSEAGLDKVAVNIETEEGIVYYKTITDFYNIYSYSLSESPEYQSNYKSVIIEATDRLEREVSDTLPLNVIGIIGRPIIDFNPDSIVYDEMDDNPSIPHTTFKVTSEAGLKSIEMYLVSANGQESMGTAAMSGENEYNFDEYIEYKEGDKGFKVKAEDKYGNVTISTLPVSYKTLPIPVLTLKNTIINAMSGVETAIPMTISSVKGIKTVDIYLLENGKETLAKHQTLSGDKNVDISPQISMTQSTSKIKVVASDGRNGKEAVAYATVYVDMSVSTLYVGSQPLANSAHKSYPNAFGMVSLKDMKTYSVDYAIANDANASNIDFKFYCFGGQAVPRLYSMDNTEKSSEYSGSTGKLTALSVKNATRFALLDNFDYESATVTSISGILSSSIISSKVTPFSVGDIFAFRTGKTSTAGNGRIGVMKVVNMISAKDLGSSNATANILVVEIKMPTK